MYNVGDKVYIRGDLKTGSIYRNTYFNDGMDNYLARLVTIEKISCNGSYNIKEDDGFWFWIDEMIDHDRTRTLIGGV